MAKKSRRARRQRRTTHPSSTPPPTTAAQAPQPSAAPSQDRAAISVPTPQKRVDFSTEYRYVINDLRSMAIIAVAMLAVLVALSFVIR